MYVSINTIATLIPYSMKSSHRLKRSVSVNESWTLHTADLRGIQFFISVGTSWIHRLSLLYLSVGRNISPVDSLSFSIILHQHKSCPVHISMTSHSVFYFFSFFFFSFDWGHLQYLSTTTSSCYRQASMHPLSLFISDRTTHSFFLPLPLFFSSSYLTALIM